MTVSIRKGESVPHHVGDRRSDPFFAAMGLLCVGMIVGIVPAMESSAVQARRIMTRLDPNTAHRAALAELPGIGLVAADKIIAYRRSWAASALDAAGTTHNRSLGPFAARSDLQEINGIGPKTIERISPYLAFDGGGVDKTAGAGLGASLSPGQRHDERNGA